MIVKILYNYTEKTGDIIMKNRSYNLDLMRVILGISVIAVHSFHYFGIEDPLIDSLFRILLITCDGLFYMISGYFNLEKEFKNKDDIIRFYKNKFVTVFFPFLAFVFVWTIWDYVHVMGSVNVPDIFLTYYKEIVDISADGHMWFMYPMFGLLLSTPFLSKMLHSMDESELKILWRIAIGINILAYYFCYDLGIGFSMLCWVLEGWTIYYFAGYYYRHVIVKEKKIKWIILAIVGYAFTVLGINGMLPFFEAFEDATSVQPMYTFLCIGCFMFWDQAVKIRNNTVAKEVMFLSKNNYMVYLFHTRGIEYVVRKLNITEANAGSGFIVVIGAYLVSLLLAFVANLCLKPIQSLLRKLLKINNNRQQ